jgi:hypothetical protein
LPATKLRYSTDQIHSLLEGYAKRGVFRGFSRRSARGGIAAFRLVWFYNRAFDVVFDRQKKTLLVPAVLPCVPADIYADFRAFVLSHHDAALPDHRRTERARARLRCANRGGSASVAVTVRDGDYDYALRRLIHLLHETFTIFLLDGRYRDYVVEQLGADPEW